MNSQNEVRLSPDMFSSFKGQIHLEKSKSIANRVLLLQALSDKSFSIDDIGNSEDALIMKKALESNETEVNLGMAGSALRFLCAGFCVLPGAKIVTGDQRLKERPIRPLLEALQKLGASISYIENEGFLPVLINGGKMKGGSIEIEQSVSSQFVSALMLIAPFLPEGIRINRIGKLNSEAYVVMTAELMKAMNYKVEIEGNEIYIPPSKTNIRTVKIEADWSAAAYWMAFVVLVLDAKVRLIGLNENSVQGDRRMLDIMNQFSLGYYWEDEDLVLYHDQNKKNPLKVDYDLSDIPDQAQTIAFMCACLGIEANLHGLETLSFKETDRIDALYKELTKLGLSVSKGKGAISIQGKIKVYEARVESYNDHRMAMAGSLLGTRIDVVLEDPDVVAKSYPDFWKDLQALTSGSESEE